jgi:hypothetical protein
VGDERLRNVLNRLVRGAAPALEEVLAGGADRMTWTSRKAIVMEPEMAIVMLALEAAPPPLLLPDAA